MVKTHADSHFVLYSLDQIRESAAVVLQIEKTDSVFSDTKKDCYLCEIVPAVCYNGGQTVERLSEELIKANTENRRLHNKIDRLEKTIARVNQV